MDELMHMLTAKGQHKIYRPYKYQEMASKEGLLQGMDLPFVQGWWVGNFDNLHRYTNAAAHYSASPHFKEFGGGGMWGASPHFKELWGEGKVRKWQKKPSAMSGAPLLVLRIPST